MREINEGDTKLLYGLYEVSFTKERYPNLKEEVDGSIPGCEISSLLDKKLATWSTTSCTLMLACRPSVSKEKKKQESVPPQDLKSIVHLSTIH